MVQGQERYRETSEERLKEIEKDTELTARLLGALGLYDASRDHYEVTVHLEDSKWAVEPFNNPCIELGED